MTTKNEIPAASQERLRRLLLASYISVLALVSVAFLFALSSGETFNHCDMTFMRQRPDFIEVPLPSNVASRYPRYRLLLYGEGDYAERLKKFVLDGVPVLFIPGHAGSYRQVRSLASVSHVKSSKAQYRQATEFNYFMLDLDEELCGIYGGYLVRQTMFAQKAIRKLLSLYKDRRQLIIIGHSMGGLVARGVFALPLFDASRIATVVTLSTPHLRAPVNFDDDLLLYLQRTNIFWMKEAAKTLANVSLLSIGGGSKDFLVPTELTAWPLQLLMASATKNTSAQFIFQVGPALKSAWTSMDHRCIVWCNQLVRLIVDSLFDMVDESGHLIEDGMQRAAIWRRNMGVADSPPTDPLAVHLGARRDIRHFDERELQVYETSPRTLPTIVYKQSVGAAQSGQALLLATTQDVDRFVYACDAADTFCEHAHALPGALALPAGGHYQHVKLDTNGWLSAGQSLAVASHFHSAPRLLLYRRYNTSAAGQSDHALTVWLGRTTSLNPLWRQSLALDGALLFYNISLPGFHGLHQAYRLRLFTDSCREASTTSFRASVHFEVPNAQQSHIFASFRHPYNLTDDMYLHFHIVPSTQLAAPPQLNVLLDTNCQYTLQISADPVRSLQQILRCHFHQFPTLLTFQLISTLISGTFPSTLAAQTVLISVEFLMAQGSLTHFEVLKHQFWITAYQVFIAQFARLPGIDLISTGLSCILCNGVLFALFCLCYAVQSSGLLQVAIMLMHNRWVSRDKESTSSSATKLIKHCLGLITVAMLSYFQCGEIVITLSLLFMTFKFIVPSDSQGGNHDEIIRILVLMMHILLFLLCLPAIIVWYLQVIHYGVLSLCPDPSRYPAFTLLVTSCFPIPQSLLPFRRWLLAPLALGVHTVDHSLPRLSFTLAVIVGLYTNSGLPRLSSQPPPPQRHLGTKARKHNKWE